MDTSRTTLGSPGALKWLHTRSVGVTFRIYRAEYQQSRTYIVQAHRALSLARPVTVPLTTARVSSQSAALLACSLGCGVCMPAVLDAEERRIATRYRHYSSPLAIRAEAPSCGCLEGLLSTWRHSFASEAHLKLPPRRLAALIATRQLQTDRTALGLDLAACRRRLWV